MSGWTAGLLISNRWQRGRIRAARPRLKFTNCVFHDNALRPGARPFPEHPVLMSTVLNTGCKTPFRLLVICREQERKLIKTIQVLVKDLAKILASRVLIFTISKYLSVRLLSHFSTLGTFCSRSSQPASNPGSHLEHRFFRKSTRSKMLAKPPNSKRKNWNADVQQMVRLPL